MDENWRCTRESGPFSDDIEASCPGPGGEHPSRHVYNVFLFVCYLERVRQTGTTSLLGS